MAATWQEISSVRKSGDYLKARNMAFESLQQFPNSLQIKSQLDWTYYDEIKAVTKNIESNPIDRSAQNHLVQVFEQYIMGNPRRPEMVFSQIVKQISAFPQCMPNFYSYFDWMGQQAFREEDWKYSEFNGRKMMPLVYDIARGLCKWIKINDKSTHEQAIFSLTWANRVKQNMNSEDSIWLDWDMIPVLRKIEDFTTAGQLLSSILKLKQNEFWVWREAARLYEHDQKDLALSCFCKAMLCRSADPNFLVSTHEEFAVFLAELGMYEEASYQANQAIAIRDNKGWRYKENLQNLLSQPWLDKTNNNHQVALDFYNEHSQDALSLCFDKIDNKIANYMGQIKIQRENKKPKIFRKFVIKNNNKSESILAPNVKNLHFVIGEPVLLTMGINQTNDNWVVINVESRNAGKKWDCSTKNTMMISSIKEDQNEIRLFGSKDLDIKLNKELCESIMDSAKLGGTYTAYIATNPKNNRLEVCHIEPAVNQTVSDTKKTHGRLKKNEKGFGFVDDIFVPPFLISTKNDGDEATVIAIYAFNKAKEKYGWKAISIG